MTERRRQKYMATILDKGSVKSMFSLAVKSVLAMLKQNQMREDFGSYKRRKLYIITEDELRPSLDSMELSTIELITSSIVSEQMFKSLVDLVDPRHSESFRAALKAISQDIHTQVVNHIITAVYPPQTDLILLEKLNSFRSYIQSRIETATLSSPSQESIASKPAI